MQIRDDGRLFGVDASADGLGFDDKDKSETFDLC